ncbi:MAG TPA: dihydrodipicolinate synthase family protein [Firmicutes bacterium]|nr:dihydrodipicolinate synthase family protein [Bacillota bacterium]
MNVGKTPQLSPGVKQVLHAGTVIVAHPLALNSRRQLDERRQRALTRYYMDAGAGGVAVGVHTTQFAIRQAGLFEPVLRLAAETIAEYGAGREPGPGRAFIKVAGVMGPTEQALAEAELAKRLGYDMVLVSNGGLEGWSEEALVERTRRIAEILPVMGFYLQPAVGGRRLSYQFWREVAEIPGLVAIKVAPFNRYQTLEVVRAVCFSSRRDEIALYTGNDDNFLVDLLTTYRFTVNGQVVEKRFVGGLLGHWAIWTRQAVKLLEEVKQVWQQQPEGEVVIPARLLTLAAQITDANGAVFDAAHQFRGCIPGIHEVLRRRGLLEGRWCLDPNEELSEGQAEEIERVCRTYPHLQDDEFVRAGLDRWLGSGAGR